jgi:hypothetical protein
VPFGLGTWGSTTRRSVSDDWIRPLPGDKSETFNTLVGSWNSLYAMVSVSLDEALSLRARGDLVCARQQVSVTTELFERLSFSLTGFCDTVPRYTRHVRIFPVVEPLKSSFFRGNTCQSAASWNNFFHWVLFGDRSRFHYKVRLLSDTLRRLETEFRRAAAVISRASSSESVEEWTALDCLHYDFTTCLRENEILLKSFLRALPVQNLGAFALEMGVPIASAQPSQISLSGASA